MATIYQFASPFNFLQRVPRWIVLSLGILLVLILGIADYFTGEELFFLDFYLIPVLLITWLSGRKAGILLSAISSVLWFIDDVIGRTASSQPILPYLNLFLKLMMFAFIAHLVSVLKGAMERERRADQERFQREMDLARQVQECLLPQVLPLMKTLECAAICKPALSVGGDYYDFIQLDSNKLVIVVADVSGKGISSALLMSNLQAMLRSHVFLRQDAIDSLTVDMNRLLYFSTGQSRYATFFCALYDESAMTMTYVNAGHNPPFLFREAPTPSADPEILRLKGTGTVLGLFQQGEYRKVTMQLQPGDVLCFFTDGVTEARNTKEEEFGEENLSNLIATNLHLRAKSLADLILESVNKFAGQAMQHDDLTVILLKVCCS